MFLTAATLLMLSGCGYSGTTAATPAKTLTLSGTVHGGSQPVSNAAVQLYAAGVTGVASVAQPLLSLPVHTDSSGNFSLSTAYACPASSALVYVVAQGGNPGLASAGNNPALTLAAIAGSCSGLSTTPIQVNEVTTVGTVWPLAHYMAAPANVGSAAADSGFASAVASVPEFIDSAQGTSPGTPMAGSYFAESAKLYGLADALAACVYSAGGTAGDGSPCGALFAMATPAGGKPPADTMTAAIQIAQNPERQVAGIYGLVGGDTSFEPTITTAPPDWTLTLSYPVAAPLVSLSSGTYTSPQQVTITDPTAGSVIHYTTDGITPTSASPVYQGAVTVSSTTTIEAIAVLNGSLSTVAFSTLTIATTPAPAKLAFLQQPANSLAGAELAPAVQVAVEDGSGNLVSNATNPVTLTLAGGAALSGTLTMSPKNGIATFGDLSVSLAGSSYTLVANSNGISPATSAAFTISPPAVPAAGAARLVFVQQPVTTSVMTPLVPAVRVALEDEGGNIIPTATNTVTIALTNGAGLGGTLTAAPANGVASFANLMVSQAGNAYTLTASSQGLSAATSNAFNITGSAVAPPAAAKLAFLQQPSNAVAGAVMTPPVQLAIQDANGNTVTTANNTVTLTLGNGTGLGGTLTVPATNGVATFSTLSVSAGATGLNLLAASSGLTGATSSPFNITAPPTAPPAPAKLAFTQQPANAITQATIAPAVQVSIEDASGNLVTTANSTVTLALVSGSGLGGTLTEAAVNGVATFPTLALATAGSYSLAATSSGLTATNSNSFTISAPPVVSNGTTLLASMPHNLVATPGGTFLITYNWQALPVSGQASVFVNFVDSSGTVQFQDNVQPPTAPSAWNGSVSYTHTVTVPAGAAAGSYTIVAGLNSAAGNLSIVAGAGVSTLGNGQYQIGGLTLAPTCSITAFGAVGDGVTDNATAIGNTFSYAAAHGCIAFIPAGRFAYSGMLRATGIAIAGNGGTSILAPLTPANEALSIMGNHASVSNLAMVSPATSRLTTGWSGMIWFQQATNYYVQNVLINGSSSTGIMSYNSNNGYIMNNTIENTQADSITQVVGSNAITVIGNRILNSGDDGVSNNSYAGEQPVNNIVVQGNTVLNNVWGRGIEVSGGANITFTGNYVDNTDGYTDVYVASETEFNTESVSNVTVSGNTLVDGGPNQGSLIVYNSQGTAYTISNVTVNGNQFVKPRMVAVQFAGNGAETGINVQGNTDYATGTFSTSSNPAAAPTVTGNQVMAPAAYTTSAVPAGGGCSFSGC